MIDLRFKELPRCIECGGSFFEVLTDFRVWLEFGRMLREEKMAYVGIFADEVPRGNWIDSAVEFYRSEAPTPKNKSASDDATVDFVLDGELLVASFMQAYGIDLTSCEMHWHVFLALYRGLPDDTIMSRAVSYRSWRKSNRKHDAVMAELKDAWRLPERGYEQRKEEALAWADEFFKGGE